MAIPGTGRSKWTFGPYRMLIGTAATVFFVNTAVTVLFMLNATLRRRYTVLLDSTLMVIVLLPALYWLVFRPMSREVAERRAAERRAEAERKRAQTYLDIAAVIIVVIGADGRLSLINKKGCEILGYGADEIVGRDWFSSFLPAHAAADARKAFGQLMSGDAGGISYLESPIVTRAGEERVIAWHNSIVRSEDGTPVSCLRSGLDITEKRMKDALIERRDYQMEILLRTSVHINAILERDVIMRTLAASAVELVGGLSGFAARVQGGKVVFDEFVRSGTAVAESYAFDPGRGAAGLVMATKRPYYTNDAQADRHVDQEFRARYRFSRCADVPIVSAKGEVLGIIEVQDKEDGTNYDTQDMFILQGLAASAAVALDNARLLASLSGRGGT